MGVVYLKDKPEAESFIYAYMEDADGNLVRISIENIKKVLRINTSNDTEITLTMAGWTLSEDGSCYTQEIKIMDSTENSRVDLQPTPAQIIQLMNDEVSIFVANDNGVILAYSINGIPSTDMTFKVIITEVM